MVDLEALEADFDFY